MSQTPIIFNDVPETLDNARIKELVGNDTMYARDLFDEKSSKHMEITGNYRIHTRTVLNKNKEQCQVPEKEAYFLGCLVAAGSVNNDAWQIQVSYERRSILTNLKDLSHDDSTRIERNLDKNTSILYFSGREAVRLISRFNLEISSYSPLTISKFPDLPDNLTRAFIRGYFDVFGNISPTTGCCSFYSNSPVILEKIEEKIGVKGVFSPVDQSIMFFGVNTLDFLAKIYDGSFPELYHSHHDQFYQLLTDYNTDNNRSWFTNSFKCFWKRNDKNALPPRKNRCSDSGFDLALIRKEKQLNQFTALYDTGIAVSPPAGYYFDVVPRSSISKTGYILANSTGIIDASYSGSIKVALLKADDSVPEITLPNYMVQLIPRKYIHFDFQEANELEQTERSDKGFGSTENQTLK
jgi:dUTP pyrophosphatase